jgi:hypothetical protein
MFRAIVAAVFGAASTFWPQPAADAVAYCFAGYLVLSAKAVWDFARAPVVPSAVRGLLGGVAIPWSLAALAMIIWPSRETISLATGVALLVSGVLELLVWLRHRRELVPVRDFALTGAVSAVVGVVLLAGNGLDVHGIFGVAGGGAIIAAVFGLIAAFGYRHDARRAAPGG